MRILVVCFALSLISIGCSDNRTPQPKSPLAEQVSADTTAGKAVAERACKACHGPDGRSSAPGIPKLASQRATYLLASLLEYDAGKRPHASLDAMSGRLSEADRRDVAAYYASVAPQSSASTADDVVSSPYEEGKALSAGCSKCHGGEGNASRPGVASLAGQQPYYLVNAIRTHHGPGSKTPAATLSAFELEKLALYFASQTPVQRAQAGVGNAEAGRAAAAVCGGCHGVDGVSDDSATASLAGQDPAYLVQTMKAYRASRQHGALQRYIAGLSDQDVNDIAAFYVAEQPRAARKSASAAKEVTEKCDRCHGAEGASVAAPVLRGQDKEYLVMALRAYRDGRRESSAMHQMSSVYGNVLIDSIATWYANEPSR